jgi:sterol 3beta-glucosyltransferase
LDRVRVDGISQYHGFATLVGLEVQLDHPGVKWRPEDIASGDFTGRTVEEVHHDKHSHSHMPSTHLPKRQSTQYIDTTLPPILAVSAGAACPAQVVTEEAKYEFNIAILNDQAWFVEAVQAAVTAAHERHFRPNATRPRMVLEVAGFDCLATDEEIDTQLAQRQSTSSEAQRDTLDNLTRDMRKAEQAAMAAKIFGLKEDEGVYREFRQSINADPSQTLLCDTGRSSAAGSHYP